MGEEINRGSQYYVSKASGVLLTGGTLTGVFTISNAPILLEVLIIEITTAVSANACDAKFVANPTAGIDTDMCTVVDLVSAAIGVFFHIDGTIANAMIKDSPGTALPIGIGMDVPLIVPAGTIDLDLANSNPTTGTANIFMRYKPLPGAVVIGS